MPRPLLSLLLVAAFCCTHARGQFGPDGQVGPGESYHIAFATSFQTSLSSNTSVPPSFPFFGGIEAASWNVTFAAFNSGLFTGWNGSDILYRAVLSDSTANAIDHTNIQGRVYNTNGDLLAVDAADFFDGTLVNPIGYDEFGNAIDPMQSDAWSGVVAGGTVASFTCGNWDLDSIDLFTNSANAASTNWLSGSSLQCVTDTARLLAIGPAITAPILGDFDDDGDVDTADLVAWQRGDGTPHGLADWRSGFGFGEAVSASVAVPEPSAVVLVLAGAPWLLRTRTPKRRRRHL